MNESKESKCPFLSGVKLGDFGLSPLVDNSLYRKLVGRSLYRTHSRTYLDYTVGVVSIYMKEAHEIHWKDAKGSFIMCKEPNTSGYSMLLVLH